MFHAGFAEELARTLAEDRRSGSAWRRLSAGDRARIQAREAAERSRRSFEHGLSVAGALGLLAIALLGPGGALLVGTAAIAVAIAAASGRPPGRTEAVRPAGEPDDRWRVWRRAEPDPEYLRRRAA
jgi:hypothetical protein